MASYLSGEFLLHILCWLHLYIGSFSYTYCAGFFCYLGSFSYTPHSGFIFIWGVSLTHPMLALFFCGKFPLHIPRWLHFFFLLGSFSCMSQAGFIFLLGVSITHPVLASFFNLGSFSDTSHHGFIFIWEVSLTHPVLAYFVLLGVSLAHPILALFVSGEFLLHIPCWLYLSVRSFSSTAWTGFFFFNLGSFSYNSHAGLVFIWGVSLTHPMLALFFCG